MIRSLCCLLAAVLLMSSLPAASIIAAPSDALPEQEKAVPVVTIDTAGQEIGDKETYVPATISVTGSAVYGGQDIAGATAGIKLRGQSTSTFHKKPYRIKFDTAQSVLDMGKAKSWTLIANYLDPSDIRSGLAYEFASSVNALSGEKREDGFTVFAPRMRPVEVFLNGEYMGLYDMGDHMESGSLRVNIDEDEDANGVPMGTLDTGYFIEGDVRGFMGEPQFVMQTHCGREDTLVPGELPFGFKLPDPPTDRQIEFIRAFMQDVNDRIESGDPGLWDVLDRDSVIDWYLVNEFFKNSDSKMMSSIYFFKDKGGKLFMGPVWDFDLSCGSSGGYGLDDPTGWVTRSNEYCDWFDRLFEREDFQSAVSARWEEWHRRGLFTELLDGIDRRLVDLASAGQRDYALWQQDYLDTFLWGGSWYIIPDAILSAQSWEQQVEVVRSFLLQRLEWMDEQFGTVPAPVPDNDLTGDGYVDVEDALFLYACVSGERVLPTEKETVCDFWPDGRVDIIDALKFFLKISGQDTETGG